MIKEIRITRKDNTKIKSAYKGVTYESDRRKYRATIMINGKNVRLGRFETELEAYNAYQIAKADKIENKKEIAPKKNKTRGKYSNASSKYAGVSWDKDNNKWKSSIKIKGKLKPLGRFKTEIEAHYAYQTALSYKMDSKEITITKNMDCSEFRMDQIELEVKMLKEKLKENESNDNQVMDFFEWWLENYPNLEFNDIEVKDINRFNSIKDDYKIANSKI